MLVLDTDHLSLMERSTSPERRRLLLRLDAVPPDEVFTTVITYEEQARGWMAYAARARTIAQQVEAYRKLERHIDIFCHVQVLGFNKQAGAEFERLRSARLRVGGMDLKIAAIALAHNAMVLTRNIRDFGRIPGLRIEDWTA